MAINVPESVYDQIKALRDGEQEQALQARAEATRLNAESDAHRDRAAGYSAVLAQLSAD